MRLTEIFYDNAPPVEGYGPGFFRVGGKVHEGHILLLPNQVISWGGLDDAEAILKAASEIDVLFVGTGPEIAHIPAAFRDQIEAAGPGASPGLEPMSTPTACRSYNVLLSEGRRIGAALLTI